MVVIDFSTAQGNTGTSNTASIIVPSILAILLGLALVVIACLTVCVVWKKRRRTPFAFETSPVTYSNPTYDEASPGADPLSNLEKLATGIASLGVAPLDNPTYMEKLPVEANWDNTQLLDPIDEGVESDDGDATAVGRVPAPHWGNTERATEHPPHYSTLQH